MPKVPRIRKQYVMTKKPAKKKVASVSTEKKAVSELDDLHLQVAELQGNVRDGFIPAEMFRSIRSKQKRILSLQSAPEIKPPDGVQMILDDIQTRAAAQEQARKQAAAQRLEARMETIDYDADNCQWCRTPYIHAYREAKLICANPACGFTDDFLAPVKAALPYGEHKEQKSTDTEQKKAMRKYVGPYCEDAPDPPAQFLADIVHYMRDNHTTSTAEAKPTLVKSICERIERDIAEGRLVRDYSAEGWKGSYQKLCKIIRGEYVAKLSRAVVNQIISDFAQEQKMWQQNKGERTNFLPKARFVHMKLKSLGLDKEAFCFGLSKSKIVSIESDELAKQMAKIKGTDFTRSF